MEVVLKYWVYDKLEGVVRCKVKREKVEVLEVKGSEYFEWGFDMFVDTLLCFGEMLTSLKDGLVHLIVLGERLGMRVESEDVNVGEVLKDFYYSRLKKLGKDVVV